MRITFLSFSILLTIGLLSVSAAKVDAQALEQLVDIRFDRETLNAAIKKLEKKTHSAFAYDAEYLGLKNKTVEPANFKAQTLSAVLTALLRGTNVTFKESAGNIVLTKNAAQGRLHGKVTDENGLPLPGATIRVAGSTVATMADADGNYSLSLAEGIYTIEATYIGYKKQEFKNIIISANKSMLLNVSFAGSNELKEVTVSYGKQRSREVTGAIAEVNMQPLQDQPVMQFGQQLQGRVAGVNVSQTTGQPGRGVSFRIRGSASFNSDAYDPLFVIDGLPITGSINNINPDEIETVTVLKDASATSLYGSRAANGVVLITTRHAKVGDPKIEFHTNLGVQKIPQGAIPRTMNGQEWATFMKEKFEDAKKYENPATTVPAVYQNPEQYGEGTNWFKLLTRTAPIQRYNLNILSAHERSSTAVLFGYESQDGVIINTNTQLYSLRINHDVNLGKRNQLKVGFNLAPSYRKDHNNRLTSDGVGGFYEKILESSPINDPYNADGSYAVGAFSTGMSGYVNPLALLKESKDDYITTRIIGNGHAAYEFLPGLNLKFNVGVDKGAETRNQFSPSIALSTSPTAPAASKGLSSSVDNFSYTAETYLNYEKNIATDHHIEALVGYSTQRFESLNNSVEATGYPNDDIPYLSAGTVISDGTSGTTQYSLLSAIGRLNYNYKGRYLLQGAIRQDGSSRFGYDRKYGYFPSVSAGWIISEERFIERFSKIDLLKIRASYGVTGNNQIGNFTAIPTLSKYYYILNGVYTQGQTIGGMGNAALGWERNNQLDLGLELALFKNRITFNYDFYHKLTADMIMPRLLPRASGFTSVNDNIGQIEFWGHEFTINTVNTTGKFGWNTGLNISVERNRIKSLIDPGYLRRNNTVSSDYYRHQVGHSLGEFYGFVNLGLYKDATDLANSAKYKSTGLSDNGSSDVGTLKMADLNNDGIIDDVNDRTFIGNPTPTFTYGITNNFTYKNFDLNIIMSGQVGGKILAAAKWAYLTNLDGSRVPLAAAADRWRSVENPGSGIYPRTRTGTTAIGRSVNTQWVEDGTYLTAKNIALGYTLKLSENSLLRNLRVFGSVQQAFILTGYTGGGNPEIGIVGGDATRGIGVDENAYPVPRTFSFGINATFK